MRRAILIALCAASLLPPTASAQSTTSAPAQQVSVANFLARAEPLERLGPLALAHPNTKKLQSDVIQAAKSYKLRNEAQARANMPRKSCPPESGDLSPETWLAHLRSYPSSLRHRISLTTAFEHLMEKHFPCPSR